MKLKALCLGLASLAVVTAAQADTIPYPDHGTVNPVSYSFTATSTGDLLAYFYGSGASYNETLGLIVNGVDTGITGLPNHSSSYGQSLNFGSVTAGDSLVFYINVLTTGDKFYSDTSKNSDGENHVYSTAFSGDSKIPAGIYVGFEDLNGKSGSDHNYSDEQFVFSNTTLTPAVPEASTWAMMLIGFAGVGAMTYRRRQSTAMTAA